MTLFKKLLFLCLMLVPISTFSFAYLYLQSWHKRCITLTGFEIVALVAF